MCRKATQSHSLPKACTTCDAEDWGIFKNEEPHVACRRAKGGGAAIFLFKHTVIYIQMTCVTDQQQTLRGLLRPGPGGKKDHPRTELLLLLNRHQSPKHCSLVEHSVLWKSHRRMQLARPHTTFQRSLKPHTRWALLSWS